MEETTTSPETVATEATQEVAQETSTETTVEATTVSDTTGEAEATTSYLDGKYNSVGALEDGYKELQKSYSQKLGGFEGAPDEGYTLPEGELSEGDQGMVAMLQEWGGENSLSNDGLNSLVQKYAEHQETEKTSRIEAEFQKLGENADRRLANARDFLTTNLGEDATKALAANMQTAGSIEAIEKLISMTKGTKQAPAQANEGVSKEKLQTMRFAVNENGERRMSVDPAYRKHVMELEAKAKGSTSSYVVGK